MSAHLTYALYAALVVVAVVIDRLAPTRGWLAAGRLGRVFTGRPATRVVVFLGWAWLGWHLFARGTVAFLH